MLEEGAVREGQEHRVAVPVLLQTHEMRELEELSEYCSARHINLKHNSTLVRTSGLLSSAFHLALRSSAIFTVCACVVAENNECHSNTHPIPSPLP